MYDAAMPGVIGSVAPGILIAPPPLSDPNFDRTVVLMALHDENGALGFVVNRLAPLGVGELLVHAGFGDHMSRHVGPVFLGGPVQPSSGWVLARDPEPAAENTFAVGENLRISSSLAVLKALAEFLELAPAGTLDPLRRMVFLGYSGWGPGQLEGELAAGAWLPIPLDDEIIFDPEHDKKWARAFQRHGLSMVGSMMRGGGEA
jgi:putative transcriptional regulator